METSDFLISENELPQWFIYPDSFLKIIERNIVDLSPWYILSKDLLKWRYSGLKERYPNKSIIPFAARYDNDDIACWEKSDPNKILIIHDFASEGWERVKDFNDFWDWFRSAIEEMIEFD